MTSFLGEVFVGATLYHINVNSAHVSVIFIAAVDYENIL